MKKEMKRYLFGNTMGAVASAAASASLSILQNQGKTEALSVLPMTLRRPWTAFTQYVHN